MRKDRSGSKKHALSMRVDENLIDILERAVTEMTQKYGKLIGYKQITRNAVAAGTLAYILKVHSGNPSNWNALVNQVAKELFPGIKHAPVKDDR